MKSRIRFNSSQQFSQWSDFCSIRILALELWIFAVIADQYFRGSFFSFNFSRFTFNPSTFYIYGNLCIEETIHDFDHWRNLYFAVKNYMEKELYKTIIWENIHQKHLKNIQVPCWCMALESDYDRASVSLDYCKWFTS